MLQKRRDHADHNYELCLHLHGRGGASDWVITIAFYACLHYALAAIFPFTDGKRKGRPRYADFEDYCLKRGIERGKHWETRKLVERKLSETLALKYNRLLDQSWTARYHEYRHSERAGQNAVNVLEAVRAECGFRD